MVPVTCVAEVCVGRHSPLSHLCPSHFPFMSFSSRGVLHKIDPTSCHAMEFINQQMSSSTFGLAASMVAIALGAVMSNINWACWGAVSSSCAIAGSGKVRTLPDRQLNHTRRQRLCQRRVALWGPVGLNIIRTVLLTPLRCCSCPTVPSKEPHHAVLEHRTPRKWPSGVSCYHKIVTHYHFVSDFRLHSF